MNADADIKIEKPDDWQQFRQSNLDVIVDPMVFRAADVFFRGKAHAHDTLPIGDAEKIWEAVSGDLGSLVAFFDQIILGDRIPLIDYGITFDSALAYETPWICQVVNEELEERVVMTVHVHGEVSQKARDAALKALPERPDASPELAKSVLREMGAFDYQWKPDLGALQNLEGDELVLARFLYGGLIFSAFAQMSGSSHVLQGKRSRLANSIAIGAPSASNDHEEELIAELDRRIRDDPQLTGVRLELLPPFLPYLLLSARPSNPRQLLRAAKQLREDEGVKQYRAWRRQLLRNWVERGLIEEAHEKEIKQIALRLVERLNVDKEIKLELGVGAKADHTGVGVDAGIKIPVPVGRIWGWALEQLPGRRYLKVLRRLRIANEQYGHMDRHLKEIWSANA